MLDAGLIIELVEASGPCHLLIIKQKTWRLRGFRMFMLRTVFGTVLELHVASGTAFFLPSFFGVPDGLEL